MRKQNVSYDCCKPASKSASAPGTAIDIPEVVPVESELSWAQGPQTHLRDCQTGLEGYSGSVNLSEDGKFNCHL